MSVSRLGPETRSCSRTSPPLRCGTGANRAETVDLAERALAGGTLLTEHFDPEFLYATVALIAAGRLDNSHRLLGEAIEEARKRGLVSQFCLASAYRALVALHRGSLADAVADAELSLDAVELHRLQSIVNAYPVGFLSDALVERGDVTRAQRVIDSAELGDVGYGQFTLLRRSRATSARARGLCSCATRAPDARRVPGELRRPQPGDVALALPGCDCPARH